MFTAFSTGGRSRLSSSQESALRQSDNLLFNPLVSSPDDEVVDLAQALWSDSPLKISPLLGSSSPLKVSMSQQTTTSMVTSSAALELNQSPLHISPPSKLHPAGEFFITDWIEQGQNLKSATANTAVYFVVVRQERYIPAVRVVGVENNVTFCWLAPAQCTMMIPLLESETAKIEGRFTRAGSATDQSKLVNGRVSPKSQQEAAAWASLAALTRTSLFCSAPTMQSSENEAKEETSSETQKLLAESANRALHISPVEPSSNLTCTLHPYQKQGLAWMIGREAGSNASNGSDPKRLKDASTHLPEGWEERSDPVSGKPFYVNLATGTAYSQHPGLRKKSSVDRDSTDQDVSTCFGGILADDMGLGKTVQIIALLLHEGARKKKNGGDGGTLIVCPLSVLSQWELELQRRVAPGTLRVKVFHGPNRANSIEELTDCDVVLTTYTTLQLETDGESSRVSKKRSRPSRLLLEVNWHRIVLDEAHQIKDRATKTAKACCALKGTRRWAVSGTPIQNKIDEIQSLLIFIKADPFDNPSFFQTFVLRPIKNGDSRGYNRLKAVLSKLLLRRTKNDTDKSGNALVSLPKRTVRLEKLSLNLEERAAYDRLYNGSRSRISEILSSNSHDGYAHVLVMLLRLRQCCDHPSLLKHEDGKTKHCVQCLDEAATMSTTCNHNFCGTCIESAVMSSQCPICNSSISALTCRKIENASPSTSSSSSSEGEMDARADSVKSTKVSALISHLLRIRRESPDEKSIVFSQWTSFLTLIEHALIAAKIRFVRLDGSMSQAARNAAISAFNDDNSVSVFLISTKAGGQGLNLIRSSRVFLMDPWWSSASESQAIDRVHRIGQTRPVEVVRFIMEDTIEESIIRLQATKDEIANRVVAPSTSDIRALFNLH